MNKAFGTIPDTEFRAWLDTDEKLIMWKGKLKSNRTLNQYGKGLYRFFLATGLTPSQLLEYAKEGKRSGEPVAERMLEEKLSKASNMGAGEWSLRDMGIAVKSFYRVNFYTLNPKAGRVEIPKKKEYRCPTQEEVRSSLRE